MSNRTTTSPSLFGPVAQFAESPLVPLLLAFAMVAGPLTSIAPLASASSEDGSLLEDRTDWVDDWLDDHDEDGDLVSDRAEDRAASLIDEDRPGAPVGVLVTFDHWPDQHDVDRLVAEHGALAEPYVFDIVPTVQAQVPASQVSALNQLPGVIAVEHDYELEPLLDVSAPATQARPAPGGPGPYEGQTAAEMGLEGSNAVVAVLDTGVQDQHGAFADTRWIAGTDVTAEDSPAQQAIDCTNPADDNGHGTHVASTALGETSDSGGTPLVGTAPAADLVEIRIAAGGTGVGVAGASIGSTMRGFEFVQEWNQAIEDGEPLCTGATGEDRIDVATLSFGSLAPAQGDAGSEGEVIETLAENGVAVTIAAGNCGPQGSSNCNTLGEEGTVTSPANAAGAIAVANTDDRGTVTRDDDTLNAGSSRGPVRSGASDASDLEDRFRKPEIAAPGTSITAAGPAPGTLSTLTGTSMSAPHVAGIAATLIEAGRDVAPQTGGENLMLPSGTGYAADGSYAPGENPVRDAIMHSAEYRTDGVSQAMLDKWAGPNSEGLAWNNGYGYGHIDAFGALCWAWDNVLLPADASPTDAVQSACDLSSSFEIDLGDPLSALPGELVQLDVSVTGGVSPYAYDWDLDDDGAFDDASGSTAEVSFDTTGTYTVAVKVTDDEGTSRTDETSVFVSEDGTGGADIAIEEPGVGETVGEQVTVEGIVESAGNGAPTASFTTQTDGLTASFDAADSVDPDGDDLVYEWSFGDGDTGTGETTSHTYAAPGTYEACLTVSDGAASDEACQDVTVEGAGAVTILTDPEGDASTDTSTSNIDPMDITKLEGIQNEDGSFTLALTVVDLQDHTVPLEAGGNGASWRVQWDYPGTNGHFVEYQTALLNDTSPGSTWTSCSHGYFDDTGVAQGAGEVPCSVDFGSPATINVTYPASVMADNGYEGDEMLTGVTASTNVYRGTPKAAGTYAGSTTPVDTTSSNTYQLGQSDARLLALGPAFGPTTQQAPSEPPEDPHIQDEGGDVVGDTVPLSQMDIEAGWFDADADNLYVGLKVADIPEDANTTAFVGYKVAFTPQYGIDDPTWDGNVPEGASLTQLRVISVFSPLAFDALDSPTVRQSPNFELQALYEDTTGSTFTTIADLDEGVIDPETDIIWWPVPREDLQNPPPGAMLTDTSAEAAPAVDGLVTFSGDLADTATGRAFQFAGSEGPQPPTVSLTADPAVGAAPLDVDLTPSTDADDVTSWTITYGDGASESGSGSLPATFSHVYEEAGTYTATLEVTDGDGETGTGQAQIEANAPAGRQVRVSAGELDPVTATCEADCSSWQAALDLSPLSEGDLTITAQLVEDGQTTATDEIPVTFSTESGLVVNAPEDNQRLPPGDVRVQGELDSADGPPDAGLGADPTQGTMPLNVTFQIDATDDDGISSWRLQTDDGTVIDGDDVPAERTHTYDETGSYNATLTVTDTIGQQDVVTVPIDVREENNPPTAPSSPSPSDGESGVPTKPTLTWTASDPDGDDLTYDILLGEAEGDLDEIATDQPTSSLIPDKLDPGTTYEWQVVADDGTEQTTGPVWSFTTETSQGPADEAQTVIAYIDSGINPYHTEFRREDVTQHPSTYISDYPEDASALDLCFYDEASASVDQSQCPGSVSQAASQDNGEGGWGDGFGVSASGQTGPGEGDLAYVPGTNIVGAISFSHTGDADYPTFDDPDRGAGDSHGTNVAGTIAGQTTGSCPDCKIVVIEGDDVDGIRAGYEWAANQPWIDIVTSSTTIGVVGVGSSPAGVVSQLHDSTRAMVDDGKIVFEAAGNGAGNLGLAQTSTALYHNFNPWTNPVGCAAPETGQPCQYHDSPNPITASGTSRNTATPGGFHGTTSTGGTSFASPSAAGVAGEALLSVRAALDDTEEGPDRENESLIHPGEGVQLPEDTALSNGVLTKLELEEALYKTARRGLVPQVPDQLFVGIDEVPNNPANLYKETYGDVYRGDWGVNHPTAVDTWSSAGDVSAVLLGQQEMPNRFLEEFYWEQVVEPAQVQIFGEHPPEPDQDDWPRDDEASPEGLDGHPAGSSSTTSPADLSLAQAGGPAGQQPGPDADRLYLHHAVSEDPNDPVNSQVDHWMSTVEDPGDGCSGNGCADASGYGGTGVGTAGNQQTYTMKNPALEGDLLLEDDGEILVHVEANGYAGGPEATPTELDVTVRDGGSPIAAGTAERQLDQAQQPVYQASLSPADQSVTGDLELQVAWEGPAYSFHVGSQGASWMQLPVATELPDNSFEPETHYLDDLAETYSTNGDTVALTTDPSDLEGDGDMAGTFFPAPQNNGIVINLEGQQALAQAQDVLVGDQGTAQVWLCPSTPEAGAAEVTVSTRLQAGDVALGGGSVTQQIAGTSDDWPQPMRVPLDLHTAFVPAGEELTGEIRITGPQNVGTPNIGLCGGSAEQPWSVEIAKTTLSEQAPTAGLATDLSDTLSGTVTVEGTYEAPTDPDVDQVTWYAQDMDAWAGPYATAGEPDRFTMAPTSPGSSSGGPIIEPQPDGIQIEIESQDSVTDRIAQIAEDGSGQARIWATAIGAATDVRVDMTVLLEDDEGDQRVLGQGAKTRNVVTSQDALLGGQPFAHVPFDITFDPEVTEPADDEHLVLQAHISNAAGASTSQVTCWCGGEDRPVSVTLPQNASTQPSDETVAVSVTDTGTSAEVTPTDGTWSWDLDTTTLTDGEHELAITPEATYGDETRQGTTHTETITVQNGDTNTAPEASLTVNETSPTVGVPIEATLDATDAEDSASALEWSIDWDDGTTENGDSMPATLTHTYTEVATFSPTLTVTDSQGASDTASLAVNVNPGPAEDKILVSLDDGDNITAIDDSGDGSLSQWHADLPDVGVGLHEITVSHVRDQDGEREVLETDQRLLRVAESGVPEVAIDHPAEDADVHSQTAIDGRVTGYTGEEEPSTSSTQMSSTAMTGQIAPAFAHTVDTVRPAPETPEPVHATDLQAALEHLVDVAGGDPSTVSTALDEASIPADAEAPLASIAEAVAQATEQRRDAIGLSTAQLAQLQLTPELLATVDVDRVQLLEAQLLLAATIDEHLPALSNVPEGEATQDAPTLDIEGLVAFDNDGDTVYEDDHYFLKVDVAGNDTHRDTAGGAVGGTLASDVSVSIDTEGEDVYLGDWSTGTEDFDLRAFHGAATNLGLGVLVDAAGDDVYQVTGDIADTPYDGAQRAAQGAAQVLGMGLLADLAGDDRYNATLTGIPQAPGTPIVAAQAAAMDPGGANPGIGLLLDGEGDDVYEASFDGEARYQGDIGTVTAPSAAALVDGAGSDAYSRAVNDDHLTRTQAGPDSPGAAHFLDTDPQDPSVHIRDPGEHDTVRKSTDVTVQARDLDDMNDAADGARSVTQVEAQLGERGFVNLTQQGDTDRWTGTLELTGEDGATELTARATNVDGATATDTITLDVNNDAPPTLSVEETITRAQPGQDPSVELDLSGTQDPEGGSLAYTIGWGDDTETTGDDLTIVSHTYEPGAYTINVTVEDEAQNTDQASLDVDLQPPSIEAITREDVHTTTANHTVALDEPGSLEASLDQDGVVDVAQGTSTTFDVNATQLTAGTSYELTLTTSDDVDNRAQTTETFTTAEPANTPPEVTLDLDTDVVDTGGTVEATVTATDAEDGSLSQATVEWGDGSNDTLTLSEGTATATHTFTETCACTVHAQAMDSAGATSSDEADLTVDAAPELVLTVPESPAPETEEHTIELEATDADDDPLDVEIQLDGQPVTVREIDPEDGTTSDGKLFAATVDPAGGPHTVTATANDTLRETRQEASYTVNHAPTVTGTLAPWSGTTGESFTYDATTDDPDGDAVDLTLLVDTDSYALADQRTKELSLAEGQHRFAFEATDGTDTVRWPGPGAWAFGPIVGDVSQVQIATDSSFEDAIVAQSDSAFDAWSADLAELSLPEDEASSVYVRGVDATEGAGPASIVNVTFDDLPTPSITEAPSTSVQTGEDVSLGGEAEPSAHGNETESLAWDLGDGTQATGASVEHAFADDGTYTVTLEATDTQGRAGTTTTDVTVLNRAPSIEIAPSTTEPLTQENLTLTLDTSDPDGSVESHQITVHDGPSPEDDELASDTSDQLDVTFPDDGTYLVTAQATDDDGDTAHAELALTVFNRAPTAALDVSPTSTFVDRNVTYDAADSADPDGEIDAYEFDTGDGNTTRVSQAELRHAYEHVDTYDVALTVEDDDGGQDTAGPVPVAVHAFEPVSDQTVDKGRSLSFTVETTAPADASPASLSMHAPGLPGEASFEDHGDGTGSFSWQTALDDVGTYQANFTAQLATEQATQTIEIEVTPEEPAAVVEQTRIGYPTIQAALDAADTNDTVLVNAVEHPEALTVATDGLTLCPADGNYTACTTEATPTLAPSEDTAVTVEADDVRIADLAIQPTGNATAATALVAGTDADPVTGLALANTTIEPASDLPTPQPGQGMQLAVENATIAGNQVSSWATGIEATGTNLTARDNAFVANDLAVAIEDAEDVRLADASIDLGTVGYEIRGSSQVDVDGALVTGTQTGVRLLAGPAGSQPSDVSVHNARLATTLTPMSLGEDTQGVHVEATCNDWGAYHRAAIEQRIEDAGSANTVEIQPWQGPNAEVTLDLGCLVEPVVDFEHTPQTPTRADEIQFTDETREGSAPVLTHQWDFGDGNTSQEADPTHTYERLGTYQVELTVEDASGMRSTTTRPVTVSNLAPTLAAPVTIDVLHTEDIEATVSAESQEDDAVELTGQGGPLDEGATFTVEDQNTTTPTGTLAWTDIDARDRGSYELAVQASDEHGAETTDTIAVTVRDDAPILRAGDQSTRLGHEVRFDVTAEDPNGDPVTLAAAGLPDDATFTVEDQDSASPVGTFAWTPTDPAAVDQHNVSFQAEAAGLTDEQDVTIDVGEANTPPQIEVTRDGETVGDTLALESGEPLTLDVQVQDPDGSQQPLPSVSQTPDIDAGLAIQDVDEAFGGEGYIVNATYTWTPLVVPDPVDVTFAADDGFEQVETSLEIAVSHPPEIQTRTPLVEGIGEEHDPVLVGEQVRLQTAVSDVDGDLSTVDFTIDGTDIPAEKQGEAWVADQAITVPDAEELAYTITARDAAGLETQLSDTIGIEPNQGPTAAVTEDEVRITDGVSPAALDAAPSSHPHQRPITVDWTLPSEGSGTQHGAQATWVPPEAGIYEATATVTDHLGEQDSLTVTITVEDALIGSADLISHPDGDVGIQERPTAGILVVDEVGQAIEDANVTLTVEHASLGNVTEETAQTGPDGLTSVLLPFDTDTQPGTNVEGEHTLEVVMETSSDMPATPDVLADRAVIGYEVNGPVAALT